MSRDRAWVLLPSGRRLDLLAPSPQAWTDRDLAIGLSRTYRWGGHSRWDLPLSVAQHSLTVLALRQSLQLERLTPAEALHELLHDAEEGLLGFDPISPLKPRLGPEFAAVNSRLRAAIDVRYGLTPWNDDDYARHKTADRLAAASEAFHVTGWPLEAIRDSLLITVAPTMDDPLPSQPGLQAWEPWTPRLSAALFLGKLRELQQSGYFAPDDPASLHSVIEHEKTIRKLAAAFAHLPASQRRRCRVALTGSSLFDTYVSAVAANGSEDEEGVVVDGEQDEDGGWLFDEPFRIFTIHEELITCYGCNCDVEVR
jgi:hypothetical protein